MLEVRQVEFIDIETEWRRFEDDGALPTVFQTYDWIECWWKHFGFRGEALILGIYDGPELVGIAPLYRYTMRVRGIPLFKMLGIMGAGESDYNALILGGGKEADSLGAILSYLLKIKWDVFWLSDVHSATPTAKMLGGFLEDMNLHYVIRDHTICPYITLPSTYEEYKRSLSKHVRSNIANICNKITRMQKSAVTTIVDNTKIRPAVHEFIRLHQDRWNRAQEAGALAQASVQNFHVEVAQRLHRYLDLKQLILDGKVIATTYSYDYGGSRLFYLPGMDLEYKQYRLGTAMIAFGIQDAIARGMSEFDFLRGAEEYKSHFTKTVRRNVAFYFSKSRWKFKLFSMLEGF